MMTDREALQFLIRKFGADYPTKHHIGAKLAVAESLGISNSALVNWRKRGIPVRSRPVVWRVCNDHGAKLPVDWQIVRTSATKGNGNGRARKIKTKGQKGQARRKRGSPGGAQQRRSARRGLPALAP